jgi:predicted nucleic acid-binding protein
LGVCDTSTLAKFYVWEEHSEAVRNKLSDDNLWACCELVRVELMSVFHRLWREQAWSREQFENTTAQFLRDDLSGLWTWIPIDERIIEGASRIYLSLSPEIFLRASDCLHLVAALRWGAEEIYTHDERQAKAAEALGLKAVKIV